MLTKVGIICISYNILRELSEGGDEVKVRFFPVCSMTHANLYSFTSQILTGPNKPVGSR
jgi:hypothetical protein